MSRRLVRLSEILIQDRKIVLPNSEDASKRTFLGLENIESLTGKIIENDVNFTEAKSTTFAFDERHILYGKLRPYLNKVATPRRFGRCSTEIIPLLPKGVDRDFLSFLLRTDHIVSHAMSGKTGSRMPRADMDALLNIKVSIPIDESEQALIALKIKNKFNELGNVQNAIEVLSKEIKKLKKAVIEKMFFNVAPVNSNPDNKISPVRWTWKKLDAVARLESGHTPSRSRPEWWGGDVSWVSLTEIRALDGRWVEETQLRTNAAGISNSAARILPRGTVCLSRTASVGFVTIMGQPMATSQDFANWVCGDGLDPEFLMYALICSRKELRELATGATHKTIYMPMLESFYICVPDIDTQRRLVRSLKQQLAEIETLRVALERQKTELDAVPQRILAQVFEDSTSGVEDG